MKAKHHRTLTKQPNRFESYPVRARLPSRKRVVRGRRKERGTAAAKRRPRASGPCDRAPKAATSVGADGVGKPLKARAASACRVERRAGRGNTRACRVERRAGRGHTRAGRARGACGSHRGTWVAFHAALGATRAAVAA
jgi:hypothetical protein